MEEGNSLGEVVGRGETVQESELKPRCKLCNKLQNFVEFDLNRGSQGQGSKDSSCRYSFMSVTIF